MKRIVAGFITILTVASGLLWSLGYLEFVIPRTGVNCWGIGWRGQKIAAIIVPANDDGYLIFAVPGFRRFFKYFVKIEAQFFVVIRVFSAHVATLSAGRSIAQFKALSSRSSSCCAFRATKSVNHWSFITCQSFSIGLKSGL